MPFKFQAQVTPWKLNIVSMNHSSFQGQVSEHKFIGHSKYAIVYVRTIGQPLCLSQCKCGISWKWSNPCVHSLKTFVSSCWNSTLKDQGQVWIVKPTYPYPSRGFDARIRVIEYKWKIYKYSLCLTT